MGNDLKLPSSYRKDEETCKKAEDKLTREDLVREIDQVSSAIMAINQETNVLENNLREITLKISNYQEVIVEQASKLQELQTKQLNSTLGHENYVAKCTQFLNDLTQMNAEVAEQNEVVTEDTIMELENKVGDLKKTVDKNENFIGKKVKQMESLFTV